MPIEGGWRLALPPGSRGQYRLAQLDDYTALPRRAFPHETLRLQLRARASSASITGTWGFGVWNDPFGLNLGGTRRSLRLPALPNAAWYFHASNESHLSFRDNTPGSGFLVQAFRSPRFDARLLRAAAWYLFSRRRARHVLQTVIDEDTIRLYTDVSDWHTYVLEWTGSGVRCAVDGAEVLHTPVSPRPPLGIVIWIDNQYAALTRAGRLGFGVLESPEGHWVEVRDVVAAHP